MVASSEDPLLRSGATAADLERARKIVSSSERIIAVYRCGPRDKVELNASAPILALGVIPCFWPVCIPQLPCLFAGRSVAKSLAEGTMYILTNKNFYAEVDAVIDDTISCLALQVRMAEYGRVSGFVSLNDIHTVSVVEMKIGIGGMWGAINSVVMGLPYASPVANVAVTKRQPPSQLVLLVKDPLELETLVKEAKIGVTSAPPVQVVTADDPTDKILRLKKLLEQGAITEEEFAAKKQELLARV
mmetsp:Transcript_14036/g.46091  ORF Transcript_14036/g.46091 Transcript_14036/m.46091 type:complete len:245 (-) Transcript_14036:998-1732(-)